MHRFTTKETKHADRKSRTKLLYLLVPIIIVAFWLLINTVSQTTTDRQKDSLSRALNRDIVHCYAVEGFYPPSLSYIEEHYGLTYDHTHFFVDYQPIGYNIRPDVTIIVTKNQSETEN